MIKGGGKCKVVNVCNCGQTYVIKEVSVHGLFVMDIDMLTDCLMDVVRDRQFR